MIGCTPSDGASVSNDRTKKSVAGLSGFYEASNPINIWSNLFERLHKFADHRELKELKSCNITAGPGHVCDDSTANLIGQ